MKQNQMIILWGGCILLGGLAMLSVYGAFLGAQRAQLFFQSDGMIVFWSLMLFFLVCGFVFFKSLRKRPMLALVHMACILILAGGMWGSERMNPVREKWFGIDEISRGNLILLEGQQSNRLYDVKRDLVGELPFYVKLNQFEILYYDDSGLLVRDNQDPEGEISAFLLEPGVRYRLEPDGVILEIVRRYENLQIAVDQGAVTANEGPEGFSNPGYEIHFVYPDQSVEKRFVFERFAGHSMRSYRYDLAIQPPGMPKDYVSDLEVIEAGESQKRKRIEVNHPLYWKGYALYQSQWGVDESGRPYSVIEAASTRGVLIVFAGYFLLSAGLIGQFWIVPVLRKASQKRKEQTAGD